MCTQMPAWPAKPESHAVCYSIVRGWHLGCVDSAVMTSTWRRVTLGALAALYIAGAGLLAGLAIDRIRTDRERVAVVGAQVQRQREARERTIRVELEHEAGRAAPAAR